MKKLFFGFLLVFSFTLMFCTEKEKEKDEDDEEKDYPVFTVEFDLGYEGASPVPSIDVKQNTQAASLWPANPFRNWHSFTGWFFEDTLYDSTVIITANVKVTAQWAEEDSNLALQPEGAQRDALAALFTPAGGFPALSNSWKIWGHRNPLFTQCFGADPNALVYNNRVYLYMSNDTLEYKPDGMFVDTPSYGLGIQGIRVVSSGDLANWTDHGAINITGPDSTDTLVSIDEWRASRLLNIPNVSNSWAPAIISKNLQGTDKFFLYWANGGDGIGVVTADSPTGPWTAPLKRLLIDRSTPNCSDVIYLFDPGVVLDDSGRGYLFFGGGTSSSLPYDNTGQARRVRLGSNMTNISGTPEKWHVPYMFEASNIKKLNDRYYFSYSTHWNTGGNPYSMGSAQIAYMVSYDPMDHFPGGYSNPAVVLTRPNEASQLSSTDTNNHHDMFEFKGETYIVYHTQKAAEAMGAYPESETRRMRSAFIDKMPINSDGTIPRVQMTRKGVDQVGRLDPYVVNEAETIGIQGGIYTRPESGASNKMVVTSIDTGDWLALYGVDFGAAGATKFTARVRTPETAGYSGAIQLRLNPEGAGVTSDNGNLNPANTAWITGGEAVGYLRIEAAPGNQGKYAVITIDLDKKITGVHNLVFVFYSSLGVRPETVLPNTRHKNGFEFDQWQFSQ